MAESDRLPEQQREAAASICVTLVKLIAPRQAREHIIHLPEGAVLKDALQVCASLSTVEGAPPCGVWGRVVPLDTPLRDGDRVEVYRPLLVDPKVARRERFVRQGARATGLFASRRPGAKAGY